MIALQELRARLGALHNREALRWSRLPTGLPKGGLVEISGAGKTEAVASLLAEQGLPVAWVEHTLSVFPMALRQRKVELEKVFFVEAGKESAWAASAILRSQLFPLLVYHAPYGEERELRRFQLLAERSRATMFLLSDKASQAWPIALSLEMQDSRPQVLRRK